MGRIKDTFERLGKQKEKALILYIMAGDPDLKTTESLVMEIERAGGDILELGVPFSDPIADGPAIQRASERALKSRTTLKNVITLVKRLREKGASIPLIIMTYYNIILQYGINKFSRDAVRAGIDGVIIPDLPPEEASEFITESRSSGLDTIFLLAPTSTEERIKTIASSATGFIYYVSMTGITGARLKSLKEIEEKIPSIQLYTNLPIAVGFGISNGNEARKIARIADGVIIGSALVKLIEANSRKRTLKPVVASFVRTVKNAIKSKRK